MKGDKSKPKNRFARWVDAFMDGYKAPKIPHYRIPSQTDEKRYDRRWRRRTGKEELRKEMDVEGNEQAGD